MRTVPESALAEELAGRILGVEGVFRIFPQHSASAALHALVGADVAPVRVEASGPLILVSARLGIVRSTPTRAVIAEVLTAVASVLAIRPHEFTLALELAYID